MVRINTGRGAGTVRGGSVACLKVQVDSRLYTGEDVEDVAGIFGRTGRGRTAEGPKRWVRPVQTGEWQRRNAAPLLPYQLFNVPLYGYEPAPCRLHGPFSRPSYR